MSESKKPDITAYVPEAVRVVTHPDSMFRLVEGYTSAVEEFVEEGIAAGSNSVWRRVAELRLEQAVYADNAAQYAQWLANAAIDMDDAAGYSAWRGCACQWRQRATNVRGEVL